jgi:hypothetical protein
MLHTRDDRSSQLYSTHHDRHSVSHGRSVVARFRRRVCQSAARHRQGRQGASLLLDTASQDSTVASHFSARIDTGSHCFVCVCRDPISSANRCLRGVEWHGQDFGVDRRCQTEAGCNT